MPSASRRPAEGSGTARVKLLASKLRLEMYCRGVDAAHVVRVANAAGSVGVQLEQQRMVAARADLAGVEDQHGIRTHELRDLKSVAEVGHARDLEAERAALGIELVTNDAAHEREGRKAGRGSGREPSPDLVVDLVDGRVHVGPGRQRCIDVDRDGESRHGAELRRDAKIRVRQADREGPRGPGHGREQTDPDPDRTDSQNVPRIRPLTRRTRGPVRSTPPSRISGSRNPIVAGIPRFPERDLPIAPAGQRAGIPWVR
jgi:hypothetical protein